MGILGADMDVCLHQFGQCNFVSAKHACIFFDEVLVFSSTFFVTPKLCSHRVKVAALLCLNRKLYSLKMMSLSHSCDHTFESYFIFERKSKRILSLIFVAVQAKY